MNANRGAKIVLSWLEGSRSQRIVWLLEELNLSYDLKTYKRNNMRAPPELKQIHPLGKSPIVTIEYPDVPKPRVLAESAAIVEHLLDNFNGDRLVPKRFESPEPKFGDESESWARYRYLMHYNEGSLFPLITTDVLCDAIKKAPVPFFVKPLTGFISNKIREEYLKGNFDAHFDYLEDMLVTSPDSGTFLCGKDLTAADILTSFPILCSFELGIISKDKYPRLAAYAGMVQGIEGYKRAIRKVVEVEGVPYKML